MGGEEFWIKEEKKWVGRGALGLEKKHKTMYTRCQYPEKSKLMWGLDGH